jgi:hypothetical protein
VVVRAGQEVVEELDGEGKSAVVSPLPMSHCPRDPLMPSLGVWRSSRSGTIYC